MYYCEDCKRFVVGSKWEDSKTRCEICGGTDLEKVRKCNYCGEPAQNNYCDWCMDEATSVVRWFLRNTTKPLERVDLLQEACSAVWVEMKMEKLEEIRKEKWRKVNHI